MQDSHPLVGVKAMPPVFSALDRERRAIFCARPRINATGGWRALSGPRVATLGTAVLYGVGRAAAWQLARCVITPAGAPLNFCWLGVAMAVAATTMLVFICAGIARRNPGLAGRHRHQWNHLPGAISHRAPARKCSKRFASATKMHGAKTDNTTPANSHSSNVKRMPSH